MEAVFCSLICLVLCWYVVIDGTWRWAYAGIWPAVAYFLGSPWPLMFVPFLVCVGYEMYIRFYVDWYFRSDKFADLKSRVSWLVKEYNDYSSSIRKLAGALCSGMLGVGSESTDVMAQFWGRVRASNYGVSVTSDGKYIHKCSREIVEQAYMDAFPMICKYFSIEVSEPTAVYFESLLKSFEVAESSLKMLEDDRKRVLSESVGFVPVIVFKKYNTRLQAELGLNDMRDFRLPYPVFMFKSEDAKCATRMDVPTLRRFISYIREEAALGVA